MLFPWTVEARDLMPERRLAEIIELQCKYVYLFKAEKWFVDEPVLGICLASVSLPTLKLFNGINWQFVLSASNLFYHCLSTQYFLSKVSHLLPEGTCSLVIWQYKLEN